MSLCLYCNDTVAKVVEELNQTIESSGTKRRHATYKRKYKRGSLSDYFKNKRKRKVMHGQYTEDIDRQFISEEKMLT
jgi:hypothetical protein